MDYRLVDKKQAILKNSNPNREVTPLFLFLFFCLPFVILVSSSCHFVVNLFFFSIFFLISIFALCSLSLLSALRVICLFSFNIQTCPPWRDSKLRIQNYFLILAQPSLKIYSTIPIHSLAPWSVQLLHRVPVTRPCPPLWEARLFQQDLLIFSIHNSYLPAVVGLSAVAGFTIHHLFLIFPLCSLLFLGVLCVKFLFSFPSLSQSSKIPFSRHSILSLYSFQFEIQHSKFIIHNFFSSPPFLPSSTLQFFEQPRAPPTSS